MAIKLYIGKLIFSTHTYIYDDAKGHYPGLKKIYILSNFMKNRTIYIYRHTTKSPFYANLYT